MFLPHFVDVLCDLLLNISIAINMKPFVKQILFYITSTLEKLGLSIHLRFITSSVKSIRGERSFSWKTCVKDLYFCFSQYTLVD